MVQTIDGGASSFSRQLSGTTFKRDPFNLIFLSLFLSFLFALSGKAYQAEAQVCPNWSLIGNATGGPNGAVTLTQNVGGQSGACWNSAQIDLTQNFTLAYSYYVGANTAGADGIAFVLQNDPRGLSA